MERSTKSLQLPTRWDKEQLNNPSFKGTWFPQTALNKSIEQWDG